MSDQLTVLLSQTLDPRQSREAEKALLQAEKQSEFSEVLLNLIANTTISLPIRQAGALFFKNFVKRRWVDDTSELTISDDAKVAIKRSIVGIMITLPASLQIQIGEAVTQIANRDFPAQWEGLIDDLVTNISTTDMTITNGVLQTAHSIFKRWRAQFRSDELFTEIAFVLGRFCEPFLAVFTQTDFLIMQHSDNPAVLETLFETMFLLTKVFYDLNSQDIPEFFEDHMTDFMGILHKYLGYANTAYEAIQDENNPSVLDKVKASIAEIAELYTQRYEEIFPMLPEFVNSIWSLLTQVSISPAKDLLVSRAMSFLTCVVRIPRHGQLFEADNVLNQLVELIVLPNMCLRETDQELFDDDPIEFIRRDLEGSDNDTRRRAATDFVRALVGQFETKVSGIVMQYVGHYLQQFTTDRKQNWLAKDTAMYLITAIAITGAVTKSGVSVTNPLVNVEGFFNENVLPDLQDFSAENHPILNVDAIKYVHNFRNQLTKDQINTALPLLAQHLNSKNYVVFTYSAVAVDALLSMKRDGRAVFTKQDVSSFAGVLLQNLLTLVERGDSPEKLAENDFLMRCVMRILLSAQDTIAPQVPMVIDHLNTILAEVSKNPANPKFNHYLFESYASIVRYIGPLSEDAIGKIEALVVSPLLVLLQNDVSEFIPYVFQLLSQMLEMHQEVILPLSYQQLLTPILTPTLWDSRGNVPALVRLMQAFLRQGASVFIENNLLEPVLGIFQKLIASKALDRYGFELVESVYLYVKPQDLAKYNQQIFILLLTRLNNSRTEQFTLRFIIFLFHLSALSVEGPSMILETMNSIQSGMFTQILSSIVLPNTQKIIGFWDTKTTIIGLTHFLTSESVLTSPELQATWEPTINCLLRFLELPAQDVGDSEEFGLGDLEELGFQASFAKLNVATRPHMDPWKSITDPKQYFVHRMNALYGQGNNLAGKISQLGSDTQSLLKSYGVQA